MPTISKRKLESYKRAEVIARACREMLTGGLVSWWMADTKILELVIRWMKVTGNIKYEPVFKRGSDDE